MADLAKEHSDDSESDGASDEEPNWELLGEQLGEPALAALRDHWTAKKRGNGVASAALETAVKSEPMWQPGPVEVTSNLDFKTHGYWEKRFEVEDEYEWLASFSAVQSCLENSLPSASSKPRVSPIWSRN